MWFDTHCHVYGNDPSGLQALERAENAGLAGICVLGTDLASSRAAAETARRESVWAGAAFHPTSAKGFEASWMEPIEELLADRSVVAVGETGIDLYWDKSYLEAQVAAFEAHIGLAKRRDKALVIHTRDSVDVALDVLGRLGAPDRLVFHCWSGNGDQLERALRLGSFISFAGNVSFKKSDELRALAGKIPRDRLLVETDAPYLAPEPHRGRTNEPSFVAHVGAAVAAARGETEAETAELTTANALRFFGLSG